MNEVTMSRLDEFETQPFSHMSLPGLCRAQPVETVRVNGVMDIVSWFDVFMFSVKDTLYNKNRVYPSGAVLVPSLRKLGKHVFIFSVDPNCSKPEIIRKVNPLGLSFSEHDILNMDDLIRIQERFPLTPSHRFLMVCSDLGGEVPISKTQNFTSILVSRTSHGKDHNLGMWTNYICENI